jgi:hypothetical protein
MGGRSSKQWYMGRDQNFFRTKPSEQNQRGSAQARKDQNDVI